MALIQVNYLSQALFRTVPLNVILPVDKLSFADKAYEMKPGYKFKTLYLLHGYLGNYTDYVTNTRIQKWAEEKNLAVIMPSGDNSFYINGRTANMDYQKFIGEELPQITRLMFPLSEKREDTFIGGLSMGGYGAIRNGMIYADTFGYIFGMSSALFEIEDIVSTADESEGIGETKSARESDKNPCVAMKNLLARGTALPKIYLSCGLSDSLLDSNRIFKDTLIKNGFDVTYEEEAGGHEWDFWDRQLKKILNWLPLDAGEAGIGSGNVRID